MRTTLHIVVLACGVAGTLCAQVTVQGTLKYRDRLYNSFGFTGATEDKPIRFATVRMETTGGFVLAVTTTSSTGTFIVTVPGLLVGQQFRLVVEADSQVARVVALNGATWNGTLSGLLATGPTTDIGTRIDTIGDVFNILDVCFEGFLHVATYLGRALPKVTVLWDPSVTTDATNYSNNLIKLLALDPNEFDDDVILHEYGHHVAASISQTSIFATGVHSFTESVDKDLAFSEAFANAFLLAVRNKAWYCDTNGVSCLYSWNAEGPSPFGDTRFTEAGVTATFYDLLDPINENHDFYENGHGAILQVLDSMDSLQYLTDLAMTDFYNRWGVVRSDQNRITSILNFYRIIPGDRTPPNVTHSPVTSAGAGQPIQIQATVTDDVGVASVLLFYRAVGSAVYSSLTMSQSGSTFTQTIPGSAVTSAGVQYYVEGRDAVFNWRRAPNSISSPPTPYVISVVSLSPPAIILPANGSLTNTSIVPFQWGSVAGADAYDFKVFDSVAGALALKLSPLANQNSTVYTFRSGSYRLEMKSCASGVCGGSQSASNFTVQLGAVPTSAPTGLGCGVVNDSGQNRVNCNWNAVTGAHFYFINVVQPGAGPGGGALTVAGTQTGPPSASLLIPVGTASVLVQACNGDGCGPQSGALGVSAGFGSPSVPVISQPFSGSVVDAGSGAPVVIFAWSRVPGDNGGNFKYRLYVQDFSRNRPALDVLTSNNFHGAYFNPATRYDALVIAIPNAGGPSLQGPAQSFITRGRNPRSPVFSEPTTFSTVVRNGAGAVRVAWTPIQNADGSITGRQYQYFIPGPQSFGGLATNTFLDLVMPPGAYSGIVRVCNNGTSCSASSDVGWGPWNNASDGEGGPASFIVQ